MIPLISQALSEPGVAPFAVRLTFAVTAAWAVAAFASLALRSSPAALRHRIWSLATAAVLALPALIAVLPEWRVGRHRPVGAPAAYGGCRCRPAWGTIPRP